MTATEAMNQIRLAELFATIIAEHAGIVAASAVYSFGRVSGEETNVLISAWTTQDGIPATKACAT